MIYPMFALVVLTFFVMAINLRTRIKAVASRQVSIGYFRLMNGEGLPDGMVRQGRHFNNLFEMPLLFYVVALLAIVQHKEGALMISLAWLFVVLRAAHAWIHLTYNNVVHRMAVFLSGGVVVLGMWITVLFK